MPSQGEQGSGYGCGAGGVSSSIVISVARVVRHVMDNREWHTRHTAMIIVKYILSVTQGDTLTLGKPLYHFL